MPDNRHNRTRYRPCEALKPAGLHQLMGLGANAAEFL